MINKSYWVILSVALASQKIAEEFKRVMHEQNGIHWQKLYVRRDKKNKWRVVRKIHDWELNDPALGTAKQVAQYRKHLVKQTRICKSKIRGVLK